MKTLIIVDAQNDFMPGGSLGIPFGDKIVPVINQILPYFDLVVATQDWHPANHKSFASNHPGLTAFEKIMLNGLEQVLWPDHCVEGTGGAEFHPQLNLNPVEAIFRKGMNPDIDSYSAFYDNGHKKTTGLSGYLRERGASDLFFCGLAADICVYETIKDALIENFTCTLVEDATRPLDSLRFSEIKNELFQRGVRILDSKAL